ncbi:beta-propeller domain-containing protein [Paenibacillus sp. YYML68]|uniref:beta-propeller domain-containing protein n=1 Tax=Paenibacillus sp. YYML68 TaxID=2909250 RepID=UPI00249254EF|nr:beta-propeller domain-containing protein [Paenibacillus sp. YYML68]
MNRSKKLTAFLLAAALLVSGAPGTGMLPVAEAGQDIGLKLNGEAVPFNSKPKLIGSTMMVPLRDVAEALGAAVVWNESAQTATVTKGEAAIQLTVDSTAAFRSGAAVELPQAPVMQDGHLLVPLRFFSESFDFNVYWDGANKVVSIVDADKSLPTVGSLARLEELLKEANERGGGFRLMTKGQLAVAETAVQAAPAAGAAKMSADAVSNAVPTSAAGSSGASYSGTNVQVQGVDEADILKTDGQYIYHVNRDRVLVTSAVPADKMSVVGSVYWSDPNFHPSELYVDGNRLIVLGSTYYPSISVYPAEKPMSSTTKPLSTTTDTTAVAEKKPVLEKINIKVMPTDDSILIDKAFTLPAFDRSTTKTYIYELDDRSQLKPVREVEQEGHYVSSRKVGDSLYVITNKYLDTYWLMGAKLEGTDKLGAAMLPEYRDSALGEHFNKVGLEDIRYFPNSIEPNYLLVGGLNVADPEQKLHVSAYLGSGQHIYASREHLYVAANETVQTNPLAATSMPAPDGGNGGLMPPNWTPPESSTAIYKFGLDQGFVRYVGRGKVPGTPLNQFSMDEHNGHFRIATTKGNMWRNDEFTSKNNVYVLDSSLATVGKLEDLAPGERIYSVRYVGDRAYMVTFRTVDPLFVIDLAKPTAPAVLGQLKIPGYSDYLHPYDENHIIGFGKDAIEVSSGAPAGSGQDTIALHQGMKLAMFDVSDVSNPKELFKESIGGRGTHSELLHNHKALLFSKEHNLMTFPVTVHEIQDPSKADPHAYGAFEFQGAYVYGVDLKQGFQLRGKVTHLTDDDMQRAGKYWYSSDRNIERLLYIGDALYSVSPDKIKANRLSDLNELGAVTLPTWTPKR